MFQQKHQACKREVQAGAASQHRNPCPSLFHHLVVLIPCLFIAQVVVWAMASARSFCLLCNICSTSCFVAICRNGAPSPHGVVLTRVKFVFALLGAGAAGLAVALAVTLPDPLAPISQLFGSGLGTGGEVSPCLWGAQRSFHRLCYL